MREAKLKFTFRPITWEAMQRQREIMRRLLFGDPESQSQPPAQAELDRRVALNDWQRFSKRMWQLGVFRSAPATTAEPKSERQPVAKRRRPSDYGRAKIRRFIYLSGNAAWQVTARVRGKNMKRNFQNLAAAEACAAEFNREIDAAKAEKTAGKTA
jgi:hypothetical protein